jgi:pilus assembly protein CpaB
MNRNTLAMAVIAAVSGAGALHLYLRRFETELAGGRPIPVLMVTRDLGMGEVISRGALDVRELPESYVEERHILADDLERVLGSHVTAAVGGGAALLWSDLDTMQEGRTLSGFVRVGMRAFALPERDVSFDGLLRPGDRVDVLFTPSDGSASTTLLRNILVLTVGQDLGQDLDGTEGRTSGRVALSVTPEQAELLADREDDGRLRLTLRNPQDALVDRALAESAAQAPATGASHAP